MRVRLELGYDGTDFAGWARQPGQRTVQGVLEDSLSRLLRHPVTLTVAGRTDAGVHATGQVAHLDLPGGCASGELVLPLDLRPERVNRMLPDDVRLRAASAAAEGFDARFAALARVYRYRVDDGSTDPLRRRDTLGWPRRLDLDRLRAASAGLLGEHDFAAYCQHREGAGTVRRLLSLNWRRECDGVLVAEATADAFCHAMVRSLVGALLAVGEGRREPSWPAGLLARSGRAGDVAVVPAHGLTLVAVHYPPDELLAARAEATRRRRGLDPGHGPGGA